MKDLYFLLAIVAALSLFNFLVLEKMRHVIRCLIQSQIYHDHEIEKLKKERK